MSSVEEEELLSGSQESNLDSERSEALDPNRTILSFCQEKQFGLARMRFKKLLKDGKNDNAAKNEQQLYKEVFEAGEAGDYPVHYFVRFHGNSDEEALTLSILEFSKEFPSERRIMLSATQPYFTPLQMATWCAHAKMEILDALVRAYPEALLTRDSMTPLDIAKLYPHDARTAFLEEMTASWIRHRLRLSVHLCVNRYFGSTETPLVPFSNSDRKVAKIRPKPWFVLSVIGYLLQREMKPLALQILAFVGGNAKIATSKKRRRAASS